MHVFPNGQRETVISTALGKQQILLDVKISGYFKNNDYLEVRGGSKYFWRCVWKGPAFGFHGSVTLPRRESLLETGGGLQEGASSYLELSYLPVEAVLTVEGLRQDKDLLGRREVRTGPFAGTPSQPA